MRKTFPISPKWICALALLTPSLAARAATIAFASFSDTTANQWSYSAGTMTATGAKADFFSFAPPNQILTYTGPVTYNVLANAAGPATVIAGVITQAMNGRITFKNGGITVLDVIFNGSVVMGNPNSNSTGLLGDTKIFGQTISYSADPSVIVGSFVPPESFSIALTQIPGITIAGTNLTSFTASATGTFSADSLGAGVGPPTPLPPAFVGGPVLLAGLMAYSCVRRKRRSLTVD